ncbi:FAS-associated factor 1, partial [Lates japonicus]
MASESGDSNMDREMILADFQACTGIDNIAEAITLLELNNWDLVAAINGVIPQENGILQSNFTSEASQASMYGPPSQSEAADAAAGGAVPPPSSSSSSSSPPSSSTSAFCPINPTTRHIVERQPRMLNFRVEYRQRSVELVLEEGSTVGEIKQILETELGVPVSKMQLKGWKSGDVSDS